MKVNNDYYEKIRSVINQDTPDADYNEILCDMYYNDKPAWHDFRKVLIMYKRNLAERIMDERQVNINFHDEEA